nr:4-hydroxythreonine-4-phosphate dehydrogenase PdxA [Sphingomonas vulcanisoli]
MAISLGDPSGIGPEITARAWERRVAEGLLPFFAVGDPRSIEAVWDGPIARIAGPDEAIAAFETGLPVLAIEDAAEIVPGAPNVAGARCALDALEMAVGLTRSGAAAGLVTGPVAKSRLYEIGFTHPGQTEFVAERCGVAPVNVAMMLAGPTLRTVPITMHLALREAIDAVSVDLILVRARTVERGLIRDFGIEQPRIAVAGLNPHAGEQGALGREEIEIVTPAIRRLQDEGMNVIGPLSPDTMFHPRARAQYDIALCLYHDQALIPLKTLHFDEGVNITLGLPIVRTAPDHGTAFNIAGQGLANPGAMIAAIRLAGESAENRARAA